MSNILIIYSSVDGHTLKISSRLQELIQIENNQVQLLAIEQQDKVDLTDFDKIIIGASIRYGKHRPQVYEYIKKHKELLQSKPSAFFSVSLVARKVNKNLPENNPYMKKFLKKSSWNPHELAVFAGKIDYQKYDFWDRNIIRLIMWLTKGPTRSDAYVDYTNWDDVDAFGMRICQM